jgi:hypothetical protein
VSRRPPFFLSARARAFSVVIFSAAAVVATALAGLAARVAAVAAVRVGYALDAATTACRRADLSIVRRARAVRRRKAFLAAAFGDIAFRPTCNAHASRVGRATACFASSVFVADASGSAVGVHATLDTYETSRIALRARCRTIAVFQARDARLRCRLAQRPRRRAVGVRVAAEARTCSLIAEWCRPAASHARVPGTGAMTLMVARITRRRGHTAVRVCSACFTPAKNAERIASRSRAVRIARALDASERWITFAIRSARRLIASGGSSRRARRR